VSFEPKEQKYKIDKKSISLNRSSIRQSCPANPYQNEEPEWTSII